MFGPALWRLFRRLSAIPLVGLLTIAILSCGTETLEPTETATKAPVAPVPTRQTAAPAQPQAPTLAPTQTPTPPPVPASATTPASTPSPTAGPKVAPTPAPAAISEPPPTPGRTTIPTLAPTFVPALTRVTAATPGPTPATSRSLSVSPVHGAQGNVVTVQGANFPALTPVSRIEMGGQSVLPNAQIRTAADGTFAAAVSVAGLDAGRYHLSATVGNLTSLVDFTVSPNAPVVAATTVPTPVVPSTPKPTPARTPTQTDTSPSVAGSSPADESLRKEIQAFAAFYLNPAVADALLSAKWLNDGIEDEDDSAAVAHFFTVAVSDPVGSLIMANFLATSNELNDDVLRAAGEFVEYAWQTPLFLRFCSESLGLPTGFPRGNCVICRLR